MPALKLAARSSDRHSSTLSPLGRYGPIDPYNHSYLSTLYIIHTTALGRCGPSLDRDMHLHSLLAIPNISTAQPTLSTARKEDLYKVSTSLNDLKSRS